MLIQTTAVMIIFSSLTISAFSLPLSTDTHSFSAASAVGGFSAGGFHHLFFLHLSFSTKSKSLPMELAVSTSSDLLEDHPVNIHVLPLRSLPKDDLPQSCISTQRCH